MLQSKNLFRYSLAIKETKCTIIADDSSAAKIAKKIIIHHRKQLETYIKTHRKFLYSLKPVKIDDDSPEIVRLMALASEKAGVGPMAAVAGALADLTVKELISCGMKTAIVENGGEISAFSETPVNVALLAGNSPISGRVGVRPEKFPIGVATSSGVYGHALSFGEAEVTTIFSKEACLSDAAATATCNLVKGRNPNQALKRGIKKALSIEGVEGVLIIYKGKVAIAGKIPKLISITTGR
jgi:hypothetical protein